MEFNVAAISGVARISVDGAYVRRAHGYSEIYLLYRPPSYLFSAV